MGGNIWKTTGVLQFHETNFQLDEIYITTLARQGDSWGRFRWNTGEMKDGEFHQKYLANQWKTYYANIFTHQFLLKWKYWNNMVWRQTFVTFVQYIIPYYSNIITCFFVGKTHRFHELERQTGKKSPSKHISDLKETHQIKLLKNFQDSVVSVGISKKHPFKISTTPKLPPPPPHLVSLKGIPWHLRTPLPVVPDLPRCTERGMKDEVSRTRAGRNGHVTLHMPDVEGKAFKWRLKAHVKSGFPR